MRIQSRSILLFALAATLLLAPGAGATDVNKELKNLGPDAHDLEITLSGDVVITDIFSGHVCPPNRFDSVSYGPKNGGPNTSIHWQGFYDGEDDVINTGESVHVGFSAEIPQDNFDNNIINMVWTNELGLPIPGSVVYNTVSRIYYRKNKFRIGFSNDFDATAVMEIRDLQIAALPQPFPLAELNPCNQALYAALVGVSPGFDLAPGESVELDLPPTVTEGTTVVAVYRVLADGTDAESLDFVQTTATAGGGR
jgi:hypothetical protein